MNVEFRKSFEKDFKQELDKIENPIERQQALSEVFSLCGDFGYYENHSSLNDARKFRSELKMTALQEKGTKAVCPRYW